jgi:hypothetical protein
MRTFYFDPDYRKPPKTQFYCAICEKDLKHSSHSIIVGELSNSWMEAIHPDDAAEFYDVSNGNEIYVSPVGPECAKKIPNEFLIPIESDGILN